MPEFGIEILDILRKMQGVGLGELAPIFFVAVQSVELTRGFWSLTILG